MAGARPPSQCLCHKCLARDLRQGAAGNNRGMRSPRLSNDSMDCESHRIGLDWDQGEV